MNTRALAGFGLAAVATLSIAQDVKVEKYVLPNGLTVILHPDHKVPTVTINTWYRVGSKDEPDRRSGFAHLFEHLMFMGTKRVPQGVFDKMIEGAGGGDNASTAEDRTNYFSWGPSNLLETLLWLDADRMEALGQNIDQKKLDLQRDVVKNERRQNVEDAPYGKAYEAINGLMFPVGHPYHTSVIGSHEDLSSATVQDVKDFFATFYVPNNASLVVAGDFDPAKIKPKIAALFGSIPRANDIARKRVPAASIPGVVRRTMVDKVQQSQILMVWHSPAAYKPGDVELSLASSILGSGTNSRLYQELVEKRKLATDVGSFQESKILGSLFYVSATASPGVAVSKLEAAVDQVVGSFIKSGPTKDELARQAAKSEFGVLDSLQSAQGVADQLNAYEFYFGEPNSFKRVLDRIRSATPASVQKAVASSLDMNHRLILSVVPRVEAPQVSARDKAPTIVASQAFTPQQPVSFKLNNGIQVEYWRRPDLPLMTIQAQFSGGADEDPAGKAGVGTLAASMLDEGAGKLDSLAFHNALDKIGATFGAAVGHANAGASMDVLTSHLGEGLALFSDALLRPSFSASSWDRVKRVHISGIKQGLEEPSNAASRVAFREFYGAASPAGRPLGGTSTSVQSISLTDIKSAYHRLFAPNRAKLFVGGNLPADQVKAALNKALGMWQGASPVANKIKPTQKADHLRLVLVDRPGSTQTAIRILLPGAPYASADRQALSAIGTVLGGTFTSRLNSNLREDKGYTYGVGAGFSFLTNYGYFSASSEVRADVTGASLKEFLAEFKKIASGDITTDEATKAASTRANNLVEPFGTIQGAVGMAVSLYQNGQPFSAWPKEYHAASTVSAASMNALVGKVINLDHGLIVLVGDKSVVLLQLADLGLPEPEVVTAD